MLNSIIPALAVCLLAASGALHAQAPEGADPARREAMRQAHEKARQACAGKPREERRACLQRELCAQAPDPKACEQKATKARAAYGKAQKACEDKQGAERRECTRREMCAQAKDPAQCEARAKAAAERRAKLLEACEGKEGEALRACMRDQRRSKK